MKSIIIVFCLLFSNITHAKYWINCEGIKVFPAPQVPATVMLFPLSTLNLSQSTSNAHYSMRILENNMLVKQIGVLVNYRGRDSRSNSDRFVITSNPWGLVVGHITSPGLKEALIDFKTSLGSYETYRFQNCTKTF